AIMSKSEPSHSRQLLAAHGELVMRLVSGCKGVNILSTSGAVLWQSINAPELDDAEELIERTLEQKKRVKFAVGSSIVHLLPLIHKDKSVGVLAVCVANTNEVTHSSSTIAESLKPVLALLTNELQSQPSTKRAKELTERTQELEWLFRTTANVHLDQSDDSAVTQLLAAAAERMGAVFSAMSIPEKRLELTYASDDDQEAMKSAYAKLQPHLMKYVQRQSKPLLLNKPPANLSEGIHCKMLALPLSNQSGKVVGLLVFAKSSRAADFGRREHYLGRHVARQISASLDTQYDLATGLYNRAAFEQQVSQQLKLDANASHALVYIDVHEMRMINEAFGYDAGDEAIVRVASLLSTPFLPSDAMAARVSGDRFVAFLPNHDAMTAQDLTIALQREAERIVMGEGDQRMKLSLSCGVAKFASNDHTVSRVMAAAELACKTAKDRGRNRCEIYLDIDQSMMKRRGDITGLARLRNALDNNLLCMYAQKIAPMHDIHRVAGVECLVRMLDEDGSVISPSVFMSVAQRYQLLQEVDAWVIQNTLKQLQSYVAQLRYSDLYVSINISGQSLGDAGFLDQVAGWIRQSRVPPGSITFEITETAAVSNLAEADHLMQNLRQMGCRFALDDFGTGVNSLSYLKSLNVQRVKIDGSFVRDLATNTRSEAMVRAVVQMAKGLEMDCVAEFVATNDIYKKLVMLGVDYVQGYYIHEPEPLQVVLNNFRNEESQRIRRVSFGT
ncbi:MAG TPA: EAL domain-containing protein, partial [Steroidobacteraceae bacterium]|nr:EAL domain-containing protein [Steroidobacteraceae bacterium]